MNAICLVIDRLHCGYLGCYGNAWVGTPGIDRLAAESFVLDGAYIDSPTLESLYRAYWLGEHALSGMKNAECGTGTVADSAFRTPHSAFPGRIGNPSYALSHLLASAGVSTTLVTDAADVARHPLADGFGRCEEVPTDCPRRPAAELEETQAARFFAASLDALREAKQPFLLWLHSQGMAGPWDAPREMRERYVAEDDPPPPDFIRPPAMLLPAEADPDELLGIRQAYAAQVAVQDWCVETLVGELRESALASETLFILLSARGHSLGVHGCIGSPPGETEPLYGELASIPWLMRFPDGLGAADRSAALVQPPDLFATLVDWFQCGQGGPVVPRAERQLAEQVGHTSLLPLARGDTRVVRARAVASSAGERALRTPAWYARFDESEATELYLKPDDRWEVNDLARRCPEVAEAMRKALDDFQTAAESHAAGGAAEPRALDEILVRGMH